jgi:hypothetical protein
MIEGQKIALLIFTMLIGAGLPDAWVHITEDDHSHTFSFFWHSVDRPLGPDWHPMFHQALIFRFPPFVAMTAYSVLDCPTPVTL